MIDQQIVKTLFAGLATDAKAVNLVATQTLHGVIYGVGNGNFDKQFRGSYGLTRQGY